VRNLIEWTHGLVQGSGEDVKIDWHGHNDRGLGVVNSIFAIEFGADRVHGTVMGVGERVGNAALDQILINLKLLGMWDHDLTNLVELCNLVGECHGVDVAYNYPLVGRDAFRTGTGVHAAAVIKAMKKGDDWLADRVYSGVPAGMFGRRQEIEISHMSGLSNVQFWLESRDLEPKQEWVDAIFACAKQQNRTLSEDEVWGVLAAKGVERPSENA
jgi:2-isopropylmalate synthase